MFLSSKCLDSKICLLYLGENLVVKSSIHEEISVAYNKPNLYALLYVV